MTKGKKKRQLEGVVVSAKMDKTIVVVVTRIKLHPKYHKRYKTRKKYKVHDPKNAYQVDDVVVFEETQPLSKEKKWRVVAKA